MSGVEPTTIDYQGLKMVSADDTQSITFKMEGTNKGVILDYDLTSVPKQFKITPSGINWTDGTSNHTTGLERLALVQTAFQAVELPPNATTLELNHSLLLDDPTTNGSITINGSNQIATFSNGNPNPNLVSQTTISANPTFLAGTLNITTNPVQLQTAQLQSQVSSSAIQTSLQGIDSGLLYQSIGSIQQDGDPNNNLPAVEPVLDLTRYDNGFVGSYTKNTKYKTSGITHTDTTNNDFVISTQQKVQFIDPSAPNNFINVDAGVPSITITDGVNTNTITSIASGAVGNLQQVLTNGNNSSQSIVLRDTLVGSQTSTTYDENNITHNSLIANDLNISTNNNLTLSADNVDLNATGRLILPSLASTAYVRYDPASANQLLYSNSANAGGGFPMLSLTQDNNTAGTANMRFQKNTSTINTPIGELAFYARDANVGNPYREFARIRTSIRNNTLPNNIDGSIDFLAQVDSNLVELMRINGFNSEIEMFQPLDMNNNAIRSSTGNLQLNTASSAGTGNISLTPKSGAAVIINDAPLQMPNGSFGISMGTAPLTTTIFPNQITMANATENKAIAINNTFSGGEGRITLSNIDAGVSVFQESWILNSSALQQLNLYSNNGANSKGIAIDNYSSGGASQIIHTNFIDTFPLLIEGTQTGVAINAPSATAGRGNIEFRPNTTNGDIVFVGNNLQSATASGSSGQHLRIKLNGTYYKIKLEND